MVKSLLFLMIQFNQIFYSQKIKLVLIKIIIFKSLKIVVWKMIYQIWKKVIYLNQEKEALIYPEVKRKEFA